jgi:uncharacterized delta-60 repeat protein
MTGRIARILFCTGTAILLFGTLFAQERWVYRYNAENHGDYAQSIVTGPDGNLYVAGLSVGSMTLSDFTVVSLTGSGEERWVYRYDGSESQSDEAYSIIMGSDGNLYIAGLSTGIGTDWDFTVVSLTPSGVERWVYRYNGPVNNADRAYSIVMGPDGNLYAAGCGVKGTTSFVNILVVSLTPSGEERWVYWHDQYFESDVAQSIAVGLDGNLYVAGWSGTSQSYDFTVVSLTPSGVERWIYTYNGPANGPDRLYSITAGSDGNLYATGYSNGIGTKEDFTVVSLTSSGLERWVYRYDGPASAGDRGISIVMGPDANLYAAGGSEGIWKYGDFTVLSVTPSGEERWVYSYSGGSPYDAARSITAGRDGNIYAAGATFCSETQADLTVVSLTPSGAERWVYTYDGPRNGDDFATSIAAGSDGNLYAAGRSEGIVTAFDITVVGLAADTAESSGDLVTGGGWIPGDRSKKSFGFNAHSGDGKTWGKLQFNDHATGMKVHSDSLDSVIVFADTTAYFWGSCQMDKASGYSFVCEVEDRGEPGKDADRFTIRIDDPVGNPYYSAGGLLGGGNIQIHRSADLGLVYRECASVERPDAGFDSSHTVQLGLNNDRQSSWLCQNSPNPFSAKTVIMFCLSERRHAVLTVNDIRGRATSTLVDKELAAGTHTIDWTPDVPAGTYFCRLQAGDFTDVRKMIMVR